MSNLTTSGELAGNITENTTGIDNEAQIILVVNYILYSLIIVIGVPGNVLLVWCLMSVHKEKVNKSYKMLVISLAINDILLLLSCLFSIAEMATDSFPFGSVMCVILWPVQTAFYGAGVFNMVALNLHRYYVITASHERCIDAITVIVVVLCWLIPALITALPFGFYLSFFIDENGVPLCGETWSDESASAFTVYLFVIQYMLPLLLIATLNALTIKRLNKGQEFRVSSAKLSHDNYGAHRRIVKMLVIIVIIFFVFGLPGQIIWLVQAYTTITLTQNNPYFALLDIFPYMYCVLNPVLFFNYNKECHDLLWKFFSKMLCCKQIHQRLRLSSNSDPNSTLLRYPRSSDSQDTNNSYRPRSDLLFKPAFPTYLLQQQAQPKNGLVTHGILSTITNFYNTDFDFHDNVRSSDIKEIKRSTPLFMNGVPITDDQELFRGSFVDLLKSRHMSSDLIRRLDASPETAIIEECIVDVPESGT